MIENIFMGFLYIAAWLAFFMVAFSIAGFAYIWRYVIKSRKE